MALPADDGDQKHKAWDVSFLFALAKDSNPLLFATELAAMVLWWIVGSYATSSFFPALPSSAVLVYHNLILLGFVPLWLFAAPLLSRVWTRLVIVCLPPRSVAPLLTDLGQATFAQALTHHSQAGRLLPIPTATAQVGYSAWYHRRVTSR